MAEEKIDSILDRDSAQRKHLDKMWELVYEQMNQEIANTNNKDLTETDFLIKKITILLFNDSARFNRISSTFKTEEIEEDLIKRVKKAYKPNAAMITLLAVQIVTIPLGVAGAVGPTVAGAANSTIAIGNGLSQGAYATGNASSSVGQVFSTEQQGKQSLAQQDLERSKTLQNYLRDQARADEQKQGQVKDELARAQQQAFESKQRVLNS